MFELPWQRNLISSEISNKSNKKLLRYCTFIFSMSCMIVSVTSYLSENEAKNLQNGDVHLAQIPHFEMEYLENYLAIEVSDGSFFFILYALSFEHNLFSTGVSLPKLLYSLDSSTYLSPSFQDLLFCLGNDADHGNYYYALHVDWTINPNLEYSGKSHLTLLIISYTKLFRTHN